MLNSAFDDSLLPSISSNLACKHWTRVKVTSSLRYGKIYHYKFYIAQASVSIAQTSKNIDCLTARTACLVCFISTVNGRSKKRKEAFLELR
jgi:hypothetical protein